MDDEPMQVPDAWRTTVNVARGLGRVRRTARAVALFALAVVAVIGAAVAVYAWRNGHLAGLALALGWTFFALGVAWTWRVRKPWAEDGLGSPLAVVVALAVVALNLMRLDELPYHLLFLLAAHVAMLDGALRKLGRQPLAPWLRPEPLSACCRAPVRAGSGGPVAVGQFVVRDALVLSGEGLVDALAQHRPPGPVRCLSCGAVLGPKLVAALARLVPSRGAVAGRKREEGRPLGPVSHA